MTVDIFKYHIKEKYKSFDFISFTPIYDGLDFYVFLANENTIFRFAKSERELNKLKFELEILPYLKKILPISIPEHIYFNLNQQFYSFVGYKKIDGFPFNIFGNQISIDYNAKKIGEIIIQLSDFRGIDIISIEQQRKKWILYFHNFINKIKTCAFSFLPTKTRTHIDNILRKNEKFFLNSNFIPTLIHSDFSCNHILCDNQNKIIGLIDWGDSTYGDVAFDFARILNELGLEFLLKVKDNINFKVNFDIDRIAFYFILIPFLTVLRQINSKNIIKIDLAIKNIDNNLLKYEALLNASVI